MKQIISILSILLSLSICSCSDSELPDNEITDNSGKCSVTFAISTSNDSELDVQTRGVGTTVTDEYAVQFYLFQRKNEQFILVQTETVKSPLYTITDLEKEGSYKIVFLAAHKEHQTALTALDFGTTTLTGSVMGGSVTFPTTATVNSSLFENCFINFFYNVTEHTFDTPDEGETCTETIEVSNNLDLFGYGSDFLPGSTNHTTPVDVIMERQFGIVEFKYSDAQDGDKLTCSFSSDYYRLYFSQITNKNDKLYTSENKGIFPGSGIEDLITGDYHTTGDYYSASFFYKTQYLRLPTFTKSVTLKDGQKSIQVYMPYTTTATLGTETQIQHQANCARTNLTGMEDNAGPKITGNILLKIEREGNPAKTYGMKDTPFPIYRNAKTIFTTVGDDYLEMYLGSADGIQLDDDKWNGN